MTPADQRILDALRAANGNRAQAARQLGMSRGTITGCLHRMAKRGEGPGLLDIPQHPGMELAKTTVEYGKDGQPVREWRRLVPDAVSMQEFADALCDQVRGKGRKWVAKPCSMGADDLLLEVPVYDAHIGKYSWDRECGEDQNWTTDSGCAAYLAAMGLLVSRAPKVGKAVMVFGGDYFHADNRSNTTEASGHALDVDTRYTRNIAAGAELAKQCVDALCSVAKHVHVVVIPGNHSRHSEYWLSLVLSAYYDGVKHVTVDQSPACRRYVRHGKCLLGIAHGDGPKMGDYPQIMAVERPKDWGETVHRHWHLGHIHKSKSASPVCVDTHTGSIVEYLPSLTSTDAWHAEQGYVNPLRVFEGFVWHREWGMQQRMTLHYQQIMHNLHNKGKS